MGRGHEREITEVKALLRTTRLLTLSGSGGCGKTRPALQAATDSLERYPDGVCFVELARLTDPAFVPQSVASALDVPEQPHRSFTETVGSYLRTKKILPLPDGCERLHAACQRIGGTKGS